MQWYKQQKWRLLKVKNFRTTKNPFTKPFRSFFSNFFKYFFERVCSLTCSCCFTIDLIYSIARFVLDNFPTAELMVWTLRLMFSQYSLAAFQLFSAFFLQNLDISAYLTPESLPRAFLFICRSIFPYLASSGRSLWLSLWFRHVQVNTG